MNTKKKFDIMNYFNVIRTVIAMVIALLIVFAIIFFVSEEPVFAIQKLANSLALCQRRMQ